MPSPPLHIRRCRRTDFIAVMHLLAVDQPAAVAERRTLRRFRDIVNDLGGDLYVALVDEAMAGLVHVTYVRQLAVAPRAQIERLIVAEPFRGRQIGSALFEFARQRANRRGCGTLICLVPTSDARAAGFLEKLGLRLGGQFFEMELGAGPGTEGGSRELGDGS